MKNQATDESTDLMQRIVNACGPVVLGATVTSSGSPRIAGPKLTAVGKWYK